MPQPTNKKQCDDSCTGPECAHSCCHDGESNGTALLQCEGCGQRFCMAHLHESDLSIFLCADCAVADAIREPITVEHARQLLQLHGCDFKFREKPLHASAGVRMARISKDYGIIYEGSAI